MQAHTWTLDISAVHTWTFSLLTLLLPSLHLLTPPYTSLHICFSLPPGLGYHDDLKTRISFIEVLTSILKQGAEFNSLADTALADRFNTMLDLVACDLEDKEDFPVMIALINAVSPENLVSQVTVM